MNYKITKIVDTSVRNDWLFNKVLILACLNFPFSDFYQLLLNLFSAYLPALICQIAHCLLLFLILHKKNCSGFPKQFSEIIL